MFRGSMQPDVTFFGFDLTVDQVVGTGVGDDHGYFIVIQEQPTEPRFGFDVGTPLNDGTHLQGQLRRARRLDDGTEPALGPERRAHGGDRCASSRCASRSTRRSS